MKAVKYLIVAIAACSLAACASRPPARAEVTNVPPIDGGWSRIFVGAGVMGGVKLWSVKQVGPVYFNGQQVGTTARDEHFIVDVKPGVYEVSCSPHEPEKNFVEKRSITLAAGETKHLVCDMAPKGAGMYFGLIGALASEYLTNTYLEERAIDMQASRLVAYQKLH